MFFSLKIKVGRRVSSVVAMLLCAMLAACNPGADKGELITTPSAGQPAPLLDPDVYQNNAFPFRTERVERVFLPGAGGEILLNMEEHAVMLYQWSVEGGSVHSDMHGHNDQVADYWVQYRLADTGISDYGSLAAPFAGEHGWYFRNDGDAEVIVSLRVSGYFSAIEY